MFLNPILNSVEHTPRAEHIRAIIREHSRADAEALAVQLTAALREVTDAFLIKENQGRPDHIEAILGPTLLNRG